MNRDRAFLVGMLCGTCLTAGASSWVHRLDFTPAKSVASATQATPPIWLPAMTYTPVPGSWGSPLPDSSPQSFQWMPLEPDPGERTFNGRPLYVMPLRVTAAK